MNKLLVSLILSGTVISGAFAENAEPTLEQLIDGAREVSVTFKYTRDKVNFDKAHWKNIVTNINQLRNDCQVTSDDKVDDMFKEVYDTLECVRKECKDSDNDGIHGLLQVSLVIPDGEEQNNRE